MILAIIIIVAIILYTLAETSIEGMVSTPTLPACVDKVYNTPCEYVKGTSPTTIGINDLSVDNCPRVSGNPSFIPGFTLVPGNAPNICDYSKA